MMAEFDQLVTTYPVWAMASAVLAGIASSASPCAIAAVPLVVGIFEMPYWHFQIANFTSAFVWAGVLLVFGDAIARLMSWIWTLV